MAGKIIDMSRIKQMLQLKKAGASNRQIARDLGIAMRIHGNELIGEFRLYFDVQIHGIGPYGELTGN